MIDIEKAKKEFNNYTSNYDKNIIPINRKYYHSYRVMEESIKISESENLSKEDIELASLIGLLHDTARFEQWMRYQTFSDSKSIDHGDFGVQILSENNFIRNFVENNQYDKIIKIAIKNHNKYKIEEGLNEKELLHSKIIRDADKIDIFYEASEDMFWNTAEEIREIENSFISEDYFKQFSERSTILRKPNQTKLDSIISMIAFIFDLNFKYSKKVIYENNYINRILDKFDYKNNTTKEQIETIRNIASDYLKESL